MSIVPERSTPDPRLLARAFVDAPEPIVDRLTEVSPTLWRFRLRWRAGTKGNQAASLALRWGAPRDACRREAAALGRAAEAGVMAPLLWLDDSDADPPFVCFEWIEGESFAGAWRRRRPDARPEELGQALAEIHETGLVHGAFFPRHVLLRPNGALVTVSWWRAERGDTGLDLARATVHLAEEFGGALRTPFLRAYRSLIPIDPESLTRLEAAVLQSRDDPDPHGGARRRRDAAGPG